MGRAVVVGSLLALTQLGCFAEIAAGYYPTIDQKFVSAERDVTSDTGGKTVTAKIGFYFDIPIPPLKTAVGLGWSMAPMGGDIIKPSHSENGEPGTAFVAKTNEFRLDVSLPVQLGSWKPRVTAVYSRVSGSDIHFNPVAESKTHSTPTGGLWFFGGTMAHYAPYGTLMFSAGVMRHSFEEKSIDGSASPASFTSSATGIGARLFFTWWPGGTVKFSGEPSRGSAIGSTAGCHNVDHCDQDGHCTSSYVCE